MAGRGRGGYEKISWKDIATRRQGKRWLFETGAICVLLAFICNLLAFSTPYWIVNWPRVYNGFRNIGLWQVCLSGLVLPYDPEQAGYHGCWWIPATYFDPIRSWLLPPWFIWTQVSMTIMFVANLVCFIALLFIWVTTGGIQKSGEYKQREPLCLLQTVTIATLVMVFVMLAIIITFAVAYRVDRHWLPHPWFTYLSWSYGMAVLANFFLIFASIALITYTMIVRQELRAPPPRLANVPQLGHASMASISHSAMSLSKSAKMSDSRA